MGASNNKAKKKIKNQKKYVISDNIKKSVLEKIKSKYNLENIFDFIRDDAFKYKMFIYSKYFQEKLGLNSTKYRIKYLERFKIDPKIFLTFYSYNSDISLGQNVIKKGLSEYIIKNKNNIDNKIFHDFVKEYFLNYFRINKDDYLYIDIFSPIFDVLSKTKIFEKLFINIKLYEIKKYSLEHFYISVFENFRKMKIDNYSLSITLNLDKEFNYLDDLGIDFSNLKRLELSFCYDVNITEPNSLEKILFSNDRLASNLLYLHLNCSGEIIDNKLFQNINNFKLLTELNIERCKFNEIMVLDLPDLIKLNISFCNNIALSTNICLKITKLFFKEFILCQHNGVYKFPKLEEFRCYIKTLDVIDLSSLINLKKLEINSKTDAILNDIQNKIPTLLSLDIIIKDGDNYTRNIEIEENKESKVRKFSLILDNCFPNVKCYIHKFDNLDYFKFNINKHIFDVLSPEKYFPLFKKMYSKTFNYLRIFDFCTYKNEYSYNMISLNDLVNFYGNLNKMTNLKSFKFITVSKNIELEFYENFINKLLLLNINELELDLITNIDYNKNSKDYIEEELKMICPSINFIKFKKIIIKKLHNSIRKWN